MSHVVLLAGAVGLAVSLAAPIALVRLLGSRGIVDTPNARSSHHGTAIRGMGIAPAVAIATGAGAAAIAGGGDGMLAVVVGGGLLFAALGLVEDVAGLRIVVRLAIQLVLAGAVGVAVLAGTGAGPLALPLAAIWFAGYVNAANFMDGLDGMSGLHGVVLGAAFAVTGALSSTGWLVLVGVLLAVAFGGFLPWNVVRGRIFLGDVGSYLLGGTIAITVAAAVASGVPPAAVAGGCAVYAVDVGVTLARRILARERWYESHRSHLYQRRAAAGRSHLAVSSGVAAASAACAALGIVMGFAPAAWFWPALAAAVVVLVAYVAVPTARAASEQGD